MIRADLAQIFQTAVFAISGERNDLPKIEILEPRDPSHGDFACNFALVASKALGRAPRQIADELVAALPGNSLIASTEIAGPGFINIRLVPGAAGKYVAKVLSLGTSYISQPSPTTPSHPHQSPATPSNSQPPPARQNINLEFVSVNPNGPITVGSGRGAAFGSTLGNVLEAAGHQVHREYYINDGVNSEQMRLFAESVRALSCGVAVPEKGYKGDYVAEVAETLKEDRVLPDENAAKSIALSVVWFACRTYPISVPSETGAMIGFSGPGFSYFCEPQNFFLGEADDDLFCEAIVSRIITELEALVPDITPEARHEIVAGRKGPYRQIVVSNANALSLNWYQKQSQVIMLDRQESDLTGFGVTFDTWFSEQSLHDSGVVEANVDDLKAKGAADELPERRKLKLAKGGVIEDVEIEAQGNKDGGDESEEHSLSLDGRGSANEESSGEGDGEQYPPSSQFVPHSPSPIKGEGGAQSESEPIQTNPNQPEQKTLWLRSTKFGDDMDRVLRRSDGRLTYIASDVAYHKDKFNRGSKPDANGKVELADKLITVLGPDHHGYIGRLHAVVGALLERPSSNSSGFARSGSDLANNAELTQTNPDQPEQLTELEQKLYKNTEERDACQAALQEAKEKLEVVIFQIVRFVKDGKPAPMRKRDGNIYSLRDLMSEIGNTAAPNEPEEEQIRIGKDVSRFFYLMRSHDTHMDFDIDLATKQSDENPVFYCQYAHARICSILEKASNSPLPFRERGLGGEGSGANLALLTHERELALIKKICDLPEEVQRCAEDYGVHRLTTYAQELAKSFHHFYDACRVIQPDQPELTQARVALCEATKIGLKAVFDLLGVFAPNRMERSSTESA